MTLYVKIKGTEYEIAHISFMSLNQEYYLADTVDVRLAMTHEEAKELFTDPGDWMLIRKYPESEATEDSTKDLSEFDTICSITDTLDGFCVVKMRKPSDSELLAILQGQ